MKEYDNPSGMITYDILGTRNIIAYSPSALSIILHSPNFILPPQSLSFVKSVIGGGILTVEHDEHKRQRRIMSPAFGIGHIREIIPQFWFKANELAEQFSVEVEKQRDEGIEVMQWMERTSLDFIGLAGTDFCSVVLD